MRILQGHCWCNWAVTLRKMSQWSHKLEHADTQYKTVVVSHDMTKSEREECKKLVEEAKTRQAQDQSGEYLCKMKVVKLKIRH